MSKESLIRPLHYIKPGVWASQDGSWEFKRHETDPTPKRWFAYRNADGFGNEPVWNGAGHIALREVVDAAERRLAFERAKVATSPQLAPSLGK